MLCILVTLTLITCGDIAPRSTPATPWRPEMALRRARRARAAQLGEPGVVGTGSQQVASGINPGGAAAALGSDQWRRQWEQAWRVANPGQELPTSSPTATNMIIPATFADQNVPIDEDPIQQAARLARERARGTRYQALVDEDASDESQYGEMLRRYRENLPRQQRNALISANRMGLVNSTTRAEQEGDIATNYARGEADMVTARNERKAAREAARRLLEAGGELEDADALAAAAQNRGAQFEEMADEGALAAVAPARVSQLAPGIAATVNRGRQNTPTLAGRGRQNRQVQGTPTGNNYRPRQGRRPRRRR